MILAPSQPGEMAAAHRRARRPQAASARQSQRPRNVEPVLSIDQTEYIHFRGRAFGVPPLPYPAGQALTDAQLTAIEAMNVLQFDAKNRPALASYYGALPKIAALLWRNCRPTGKVRRFLHWIRIYPNPFAKASDGELLEFADFFLARRMRSGARPPQMAATQARRTP